MGDPPGLGHPHSPLIGCVRFHHLVFLSSFFPHVVLFCDGFQSRSLSSSLLLRCVSGCLKCSVRVQEALRGHCADKTDSGGMCSGLPYLHKHRCRFESQEKNVQGKIMRISNVTQNIQNDTFRVFKNTTSLITLTSCKIHLVLLLGNTASGCRLNK